LLVEITEISEPDRMKEIFAVAESAWGMEEPESFIADLLTAVRFHGGLVLGAYDGPDLVGFLFGIIGRTGDRYYIYSHMTGVAEGKKYSGIGHRLKLRQREWAREHGYELVAWTFDPLMSLNGNFNIRKLGAISRTYLVNFYGTMTDRLNAGIETDRFIAEWWTGEERKAEAFRPEDYEAATGTVIGKSGMRELSGVNFPKGDRVTVEIPYDFVRLKQEAMDAAVRWRMETRRLFRSLFSRGYIVTSFASREGRSYYLLDRKYPMPQAARGRVFRLE
jgi:predicted GNAT superfamily acetyltransferase